MLVVVTYARILKITGEGLNLSQVPDWVTLGGERFKSEIEMALGRSVRPKQRSRPSKQATASVSVNQNNSVIIEKG